jgi:4-hydroxybenzoate polyprenyltransferase
MNRPFHTEGEGRKRLRRNEPQMVSQVVVADYLKIARFDHWVKQLFIFPGSIFSYFVVGGVVLDKSLVFRLVTGFIATCFIASANYIINEWLDAEFDKFHPIKKLRPFVSAHVNPSIIIAEYAVFSLAGLFFAYITSLYVFIVEVSLFVMGILYNVRPIRTKEIPFVDVISESLNNALRLLIGWFIITSQFIPPVSIVLGYWMGGAFLMATKRFSEYRMINDKTQAIAYRKSFKYYNEKRLLVSAFFYALLSVFFCGIFMIKYRLELLIAIPFLCGLFCVYLNICYKPDSSAQKPEKLFQEKGLMLYITFFIVIVILLMLVPIPSLQWFLDTSLIWGVIK